MPTTATHARSSIWTELHREWAWLITRPASHDAVAAWSSTYSVFADATSLQDVVEIVSHRPDRAVVALLTEHHSGHKLAGRVLTQCMLPKLMRSARYARTPVHERSENYFDERAQQTLAAFHDVLGQWRPGAAATAASLGLDTLHKITKLRPVPAQYPVEPDSTSFDFPDRERAESDPLDARSLIEWAAVNRVLNDSEMDLLDRAYVNPTGTLKTLALDLAVSDAALRQRLSRAVGKLRVAVLASVQSNTFDAFNGDITALMAA
ncbi:hypothetical protein G6031_02815 [Dietzia sp. CQ4]|uniref:hypothetical protein n=1 Tax=Dietzia sp. (strain CQ4) TaxID=370437 RepID=UPI0015F8E428|nr:hypothetical protein [Dietzia sp. CQ4]MBB1033320.1 hypothetical protein [Dietzia sp. CQ4]